MKIGYARISRGDHQDLDAQLAALVAAGCDHVFREEASGRKHRAARRIAPSWRARSAP
ncbi:recombinase family protein [Novosphingobium lindaniclasticum]|uniref:recombinase family protein n=1 Tax=Novosphingobium lindaniclasticum TaxID=1329895 RepID=UPI00240A76B7|nr:recombinase family protein [Novosphingobium lindaniclasticum]